MSTSGNARRLLSAISALAVMLSGFCFPVPNGHASTRANVLMINSYHFGYRWSDQVVKGFRETLMAAAPRTELYVEYLDSKRIYSPSAFDRLADLIREKYRHVPLDAVIAADDNSLRFLKQHRRSLFAGVPAVFCGANELDPATLDGMAPVTGINETADVHETIDLALDLMPATKRIVVVNDTTPTGRNVHREIKRVAAAFSDRVAFTYWEDVRREDLLGQLAGLKNGDIVLYTFFFRDSTGRFYGYEDSARQICAVSPVPVFGLWEFNLGHGIVGGKLVSGFEQGRAAGKMTLRIIGGEKADDIPLQMKSPNRFSFDFHVLEKFGIDESRLPAASLVTNLPTSMYREYSAFIWSGIIAIVSLAVLSLFLLVNIGKRRKVERQMSQIINFLPDPTFVIDKERRVIAWNRAMEELTGVKAEAMLGRGNYEYALPLYGERRPMVIDLIGDWNDEIAERYDYVRQRGDRLFSETREPYRPLGDRHFHITAGPLYDENGSAAGAIETIHDITDRRAVERALEERETLLRLFVEYTPAAVAMCDTGMNYLAHSQRWVADYHLPDADLRGRCHYDVFEVIPDHWKEQHRRCFQGEVIENDEEPFIRADGTRDWVRRSLHPWRTMTGEVGGLILFTEVVTHKRQAEENLRMMERVLKNSPAVLFRWEAAQGWPVSYVSENVSQFGYSPDEFLLAGKPYASVIHPDDLDAVTQRRASPLHRSATHYQQEYRLVTQNGDCRWVDDRTMIERDENELITHYQGVVLDITDRKVAMEELRRLRNFLSNIINSMPSVMVGVDGKGRVTQWNKQAERATGFTFEKACSQPLMTVFPPLMDEMDRIKTAIEDRRVLRDIKIPRHVNGETRFEDVTIFPLVDNGVAGAVIRVDDVTERVRLEEMMIQSEKMLSVGGLAAGMAHEINNPLAGILQNSAVLSNRLFGDLPANRKAAEAAGTTLAAIQRYLELRRLPDMLDNIRTSGNRAAAIVRNMLSFARKSDRIVSSHDLGSLLDQTVELARTDYDMRKRYDFKQIRIVREYDGTVPPVPCEASKVQQVFLNILKNGAEAMADVADGQTQPVFTLRVKDDGSWVRVEIEDNGPGMDEKTRRRIFEPFFTTKPVGVGTGLGLSVSYFIITENHGGKMDVFSANGEGTRFVIRLPKHGRE